MRAIVIGALSATLFSTTAQAAPPKQVELHPSLKKTHDSKVIHHYGHDYLPSPSCQKSVDLPDTIPFIDDFRHKVFLNFDGAKLTQGQSNSQKNTTGLIKVATMDFPAMVWGAYGGREKGIKDTLEELVLLYNIFSVEFVTERPTEGDYTMVMIGGNGQGIAGGSAVGLAPLDCNNDNKNDIASVFGAKISPSPKKLAFVIAHELGHTFGLEHVKDPKGIMAPALSEQTCCWVSDALTEPPGTCGRNGQQDSVKVLTENVGAGPGDTVPPKIWFVRPGDGAILPSNFVFEVTAGDDLRVHHVELFFDSKKVAELDKPPFLARVTGASDGEHTLEAIVYDFKPNKVKIAKEVSIDGRCVLDGRCNGGIPGPGAGCSRGADCGSGICVLDKAGKGLCAQRCDGADDICPEGAECKLPGGTTPARTPTGSDAGAGSSSKQTWACTKELDGFTFDVVDSGGGCAVSKQTKSIGGLASSLLLLGLLALGRRRRRRSLRARHAPPATLS